MNEGSPNGQQGQSKLELEFTATQEEGERRGNQLGKTFSETAILKAIREAASNNDTAMRSGIIKGFSIGLAETVFPTSSASSPQMESARFEYALGTWTVMSKAIDAIRHAVPYERLNKKSFISRIAT